MGGFSEVRAYALAKELDLGLDGICCACLSFVSIALDRGDEAAVKREVRRMTPDIWADGLDEQALASVRRAAELGVTDAGAALTDLELGGGRSFTARAIVRKLAEDLCRHARITIRAETLTRDRLLFAPPEWN